MQPPVLQQEPQRSAWQAGLQQFEPLLPAEQLLLRASVSGAIAKIGLRRPRQPTSDLRLRAEFISYLARSAPRHAVVSGKSLQIVGAYIVGRLDLANAKIRRGMWFYRCFFVSAPRLDGAHVVGSLTFADCSMPSLQAHGCRIEEDFALNAGSTIEGDVILKNAHIGRDLDCERLRILGAARDPSRFVLDGASIAGHALLGNGFEAVGEVRFAAARIGGDLRLSKARITADIDPNGVRGVALNLDHLRTGGSVLLNDGFSAGGQVRLQQVRIKGDLDCTGAAFDVIGDASWGENGATVLLDRARISGSLILRQLQGPLQGASLVDAQVGTLIDDVTAWGQHHVLDGFRYGRFAADAPTDAPMRVEWLSRQSALHVGDDFRPDPWRRLIKVLLRMGRDPSARDVAIARERYMRRAGKVGLDAPAALRWLVRLAHDLFGLFAAYGHRPMRLLAWTIMLWVLCGTVYWQAAQQGALAPSAELALADPRLDKCRTECKELPAAMPAFQPFIYSLDVLLPMIDLQQRRQWSPVRDAYAREVENSIGTPVLRVLMWFEALCGWAAGLTLLIAATGLTNRDRRN